MLHVLQACVPSPLDLFCTFGHAKKLECQFCQFHKRQVTPFAKTYTNQIRNHCLRSTLLMNRTNIHKALVHNSLYRPHKKCAFNFICNNNIVLIPMTPGHIVNRCSTKTRLFGRKTPNSTERHLIQQKRWPSIYT